MRFETHSRYFITLIAAEKIIAASADWSLYSIVTEPFNPLICHFCASTSNSEYKFISLSSNFPVFPYFFFVLCLPQLRRKQREIGSVRMKPDGFFFLFCCTFFFSHHQNCANEKILANQYFKHLSAILLIIFFFSHTLYSFHTLFSMSHLLFLRLYLLQYHYSPRKLLTSLIICLFSSFDNLSDENCINTFFLFFYFFFNCIYTRKWWCQENFH